MTCQTVLDKSAKQVVLKSIYCYKSWRAVRDETANTYVIEVAL